MVKSVPADVKADVASPGWATERLAAALAERDLQADDVITVREAWQLYGTRRSSRNLSIGQLALQVGSPEPADLFTVGMARYFLYDDVLAWMAPALASRWDRAYEARRRDVEERWRLSPNVRRAAVAAYAAGESSNSIAKRLTTSPSIVLGWVRQDGAKVRPKGSGGKRDRVVLPAEVKADAVAAYLCGESLVSIAERFGVSHVSVRAWVIAAGHALRPRNPHCVPDERRAAALALYRQGVGSKTVAKRLGISSHVSVLQWAHAAGVEVRPKGRPRVVSGHPQSLSPSCLTSS